MKGSAIRYSEEELAWIEERAHLPRRVLHAAFLYVFLRDDVSQANLTSLCKRRGWLTGRTGRFEPGVASWSAGKKVGPRGRSVETQFKKGDRKGRANHLWKPVGTERVAKDGYVERKVHDGLPMQSRWRGVHLIRWEEANGPVPKGHALKCLDGDRGNTDPSNWIAVPRAILPRLAGRWARSFDDAPDEIKPTLLAIAKLEHAAREARRAKKERAA
jgi:hypothetical protein